MKSLNRTVVILQNQLHLVPVVATCFPNIHFNPLSAKLISENVWKVPSVISLESAQSYKNTNESVFHMLHWNV
jgi:hypothetical protein